MIISTNRVGQAGSEPVTLDEAKLHLRLDTDDSDSEISAFISAATDYAENFCQQPFTGNQDYPIGYKWVVLYDGFSSSIELPFSNVSSITTIEYLDSSGEFVSIDQSEYTFDSERREIRPTQSWPTGSNVKVSLIPDKDYGTPPSVKQAILMLVSDMYENRSAQSIMQIYENRAAHALLMPYRVRMGV